MDRTNDKIKRIRVYKIGKLVSKLRLKSKFNSFFYFLCN